jgi:hypothetical protein
MKLLIVDYGCALCGREFSAPDVPHALYGEFLLRSHGAGRMAFLDGLGDEPFQEVAALVEAHTGAERSSGVLGGLLHGVYGAVACDPDQDGNAYHLNLNAPCPHCASQQIKARKVRDPIEVVEVDVSPVTHAAWDAMGPEERARRVGDQLKALSLLA